MSTVEKLNLNARTIIEKTKLGWNLEKISGHFGLDSYSFETALVKKFGEKKSKELLDNIRKNNKKRNGPRGKASSRKEKSMAKHEIEKEHVQVEEPEVEDNSKEESETQTPKPTNVEYLEVENQITSLTNEILDIEKNRKDLLAKKLSHQKELAKIRDDINVIRKSLMSKKERMLTLVEEMNTLSEKAAAYFAEAKEKNLEVENLQKRLEQLKKMTIFVLGNGQLQLDSGEIVDFSEESKEFYYRMISEEIFEDLTVKEIKQLSQLVYLAIDLKEKKIEYDILFDSSKMETLFNKAFIL